MKKNSSLFDELNIFRDIDANKDESTIIIGADRSYKIAIANYLREERSGSIFFVCQNDYEAKRYYNAFLDFIDEDDVLFYPKEPLYFTFADSFSREITNLRLRVMNAALAEEHKIIVTSVWALAEVRLFDPPDARKLCKVKEELSIDALVNLLNDYGYEREEKTEAPGQYSVRGGIVDFYSSTAPYPVRAEFFGDEIDSARYYDPDSQLSVEKIDCFDVYPFSDFLLTQDEIEEAISNMRKEAVQSIAKIKDEEDRIEAERNAADLFEKLYDNPDEAVRLIYMYTGKELSSVLSLFENKYILLCEPNNLYQSYQFIEKTVAEDFVSLQKAGLAFPNQHKIFMDYPNLMQYMQQSCFYTLASVDQPVPFVTAKRKINAACADMIDYKGNVNIFVNQIAHYLQNDYKVILTYRNDTEYKALKNLLTTYDLKENMTIEEGVIALRKAKIHAGMDFASDKIVVISYASLVIKESKKKKKRKRDSKTFFSDIKPGDYVVHEVHGIGRYEGIHQIESMGVTKDYMKISYAKEDVLYVPAEQMDLIQKYIGARDGKPKLNRLGSNDWATVKSKATRAVKELAAEYLTMYAQRQQQEGFAFSPDTAWQKEFEDKFEFEPTEDQITCTEEIKADMEKPVPMDRLLCGDVGYGKTEVAQRAAFKAVMDSKQVAVLVPTTILALQHYTNFLQRFQGYPIRIEMMSRLRTPKQIKQTIENLRTGTTDIVIGTHRILSKDIKFKDLGLLIVDEEQRFGVAHKDKLKLLKNNVDTLTLSATPIPRTLHMSLTGIRDMSIIETPPTSRVQVQTYVMEYDDTVIREAIKNELVREGQIFYIYNRVQTIERCAEHVHALVPEARVAYAHGQMKEKELESIILGFLNKEYDVLVSTTIIENGIDIINANTIIIENADTLGLSQLYQLRGRVGRKDTAAYAYMTYRKDKTLSEIASKRLQSIKEFTKFGSGFKIAMRDLQVRGAGNLLGANQHGHFQNVGYEMYYRLLADAVAEEMGQQRTTKRETEIDLQTDAYLPKEYIPSEDQRIDLYKTIAAIENDEDLERVKEEIVDIYSDMPHSVEQLLKIAHIKYTTQKLAIQKIKQRGEQVLIEFYADAEVDFVRIQELSSDYKIKIKTRTAVPTLVLYVPKDTDVLIFVSQLIDDLI